MTPIRTRIREDLRRSRNRRRQGGATQQRSGRACDKFPTPDHQRRETIASFGFGMQLRLEPFDGLYASMYVNCPPPVNRHGILRILNANDDAIMQIKGAQKVRVRPQKGVT